MYVLVLNTDNQPYDVWGWHKGITKALCTNSVIVIKYYDKHVKDGKGNLYPVPAIIVLKEFAKSATSIAKFSKINIYARDLFQCQYCGVSVQHSRRTIDHVIPKSQYKPHIHKVKLNSFENVVTCCYTCNSKKGNRTPDQAQMKLLSKPRKITRQQVYANKLKLIHHIPLEWKDYIQTYAAT